MRYQHELAQLKERLERDIKHPLKYARLTGKQFHLDEAHDLARQINKVRDQLILAPCKVEELADDGIFWGMNDPRDTDELQIAAAKKEADVEFNGNEAIVTRDDQMAIVSLIKEVI